MRSRSTECYDTGQLRVYLEDPATLPHDERMAMETHLAACPACREALSDLRALEARVTPRISALAPTQAPDIQAALLKMRARLRDERAAPNATTAPAQLKPTIQDRSNEMQPFALAHPGLRRAIFSTLAAALVVTSFVAFPSLRTAADSLLQTFRAQSVIFLPIDGARLQQLRDLNTDPTSLFLTKPTIIGEPKSTVVGSLDEAAKLAGFGPEKPNAFPSTPQTTQITVQDGTRVQAQVNVAAVRDVIQALGITDVTLPDALGSAPITADVPAFVQSEYTGTGYHFTLVQGRSPTVAMPSGVDLAQLGRAGLRLIGMAPEQADEMSRQIDWSSTLVVPFPAGLRDVMRVQIGDAQGLLVSAYGGSDSGPIQPRAVVYWQNGDHFYVLAGEGDKLSNDVLLLAARSVK